jgi:hypothetical protein
MSECGPSWSGGGKVYGVGSLLEGALTSTRIKWPFQETVKLYPHEQNKEDGHVDLVANSVSIHVGSDTHPEPLQARLLVVSSLA